MCARASCSAPRSIRCATRVRLARARAALSISDARTLVPSAERGRHRRRAPRAVGSARARPPVEARHCPGRLQKPGTALPGCGFQRRGLADDEARCVRPCLRAARCTLRTDSMRYLRTSADRIGRLHACVRPSHSRRQRSAPISAPNADRTTQSTFRRDPEATPSEATDLGSSERSRGADVGGVSHVAVQRRSRRRGAAEDGLLRDWAAGCLGRTGSARVEARQPALPRRAAAQRRYSHARARPADHARTYPCTNAHASTRVRTRARTVTRTHAPHSRTHAHKHTHARVHKRAQAHTLAYTHARARARARTNAHAQHVPLRQSMWRPKLRVPATSRAAGARCHRRRQASCPRRPAQRPQSHLRCPAALDWVRGRNRTLQAGHASVRACSVASSAWAAGVRLIMKMTIALVSV